MLYWTTKRYPTPVTRLLIERLMYRTTGIVLLLLAAAPLKASTAPVDTAIATPAATTSSLAPHTAVYTSSGKGLSAKIKQKLTNLGNHRWQLHNAASIMWVGFEEKALFTEKSGQVIPGTYHYNNKLSSKRNSNLIFDWANSAVTDTLHSDSPLALPDGALDKLSFQAQLRLDLLNQKLPLIPPASETNYHLVDRTRYKTYNIKYLGEEIIETPAGKFNAVKIKQRRPDKEKHTLIWLAKDWDYFVLRIQRIKNGKSDYLIELKQATIAEKKIQGL